MPSFIHTHARRRLRWLLGTAGLLSGVLITFVILRSRPQPVALREVLRSDLVQREGRWYQSGQTTPFCGVLVERYPTGVLKCQTRMDQGLPDGLSEGWHTNGQKQVEEHFRAGVSHGLRTKWYENGRKLSEIMVVNGKLHGVFRRWSEDGALSEEAELKAGEPDGLSRAFYRDGSVKVEARLQAGQLVERRSWKQGEKNAQSP